MLRYVAIDYGSKRIGLAVSTGSGIASPLRTMGAGGTPAADAAAVLTGSRDYEVDEFIVGLPLNMDGTEGSQARQTRAFGAALALASGKPVRYWDERLSSLAAEDLIQPEALTRRKKKKRLDSVAAQVILQDFLAHRSGEPGLASDRSEPPHDHL